MRKRKRLREEFTLFLMLIIAGSAFAGMTELPANGGIAPTPTREIAPTAERALMGVPSAMTAEERDKLEVAWRAQVEAEAAGTRRMDTAGHRLVDSEEWQAMIDEKHSIRLSQKPPVMDTPPGVPSEAVLSNVVPFDGAAAVGTHLATEGGRQ